MAYDMFANITTRLGKRTRTNNIKLYIDSETRDLTTSRDKTNQLQLRTEEKI